MYNIVYYINDHFMKNLDTRDLIKKQEGLKDFLLAVFNIEDVYSYEGFIETATEDFKNNYLVEIEAIEEIESIINEIGDEARYGIYLVHVNNIEDYIKEYIKYDLGLKIPEWVEINYRDSAENFFTNYIEYKQETYYYV